MGQTVKLRRSAVSGRVPINSQLQLGELSVNTADGKLFFAKSGSLGPSIEEIITTNTQNTGSIDLVGALTASVVSSSFIGDGSELYNIPASGVVGLSLDQISSDGAVAAITAEQLDINVNTVIDGSLTATEITGSGLGLTNVPVNISGSSHTSTNYNGLFTKIHFDESTGIKVEGDTSTGIAKIYLDGVASESGGGDGSTKFIEVTTPSSTWTFNHGLGEKYPSIMVFDSNNNVIIPQNIEAVSTTQLVVSFASPQIGYVTATVGGGLPTTTASDNKTLVTLSGVPTWKEGILSGSVSFNSFSSSIDTIIGSLETESGSVRTTLNTYTSSNNIRVDSIESKTGSFLVDSDLSTLEGKVGSLETESGSVRTTLNTYTSSNDGRVGSLETTSGSHDGRLDLLEIESGSVRSTLNTYTSSNDSRVDSIESQTGSYLIDSDLSTLEGQVGSLETESGSVRSALNTYTASNDSRVEDLVDFKDDTETAIELTGSNVTIKGNLLVKGTETRVNSTTVEVSDNVISLNGSGAANGGIEVRDVTSPGILSGSLIWDGTDNKWKAGVKGSEDGIVLVGDLNSFTSSNDDRLDRIELSTSSLNSFTSSINTTIKSKLNTEGVISGSIQIDHDSTTNFVANEHIDHSSITIGSGKGLSGGGSIDTSRSLTLDTGSAHFLGGVKSKLNTETVVSGSVQIDITGTTNYNLVDGRLDSLESNSGSYLTEYNDEYTTGATFNSTNGVITYTRNDGDTFTVDLDGRYLTSFTETDPIFTASPSAGITETNITNWDSAYTYSTVGHLPLSGGTITGDVRFLDSDQLKLGTDNDLRLWHNGTNSYVFNYNGDLNVGSRNGDLKFLGSDGSTGEVTYFFLDGSQQNINFQKDAIFTDNKKVLFGGSGDLQMYHDGTNSYIKDNGTGVLNIQGSTVLNIGGTNGEVGIQYTENAGVTLRHNNVVKFTTDSTGVSVTGIINATGGNSSQWNTAYGWGDHASVGYITGFTNTNEFTTGATFNSGNGVVTFTRNNGGDTFTVDLDGRYLTSFTETDPIFTASPSAGITDTNISNWNTAYGWGDHSQEGYITSFTDTNEFTTGATFNSTTGIITFTRNNGGDTFTVDIDGKYLPLSGGTITGDLIVNGYIRGSGQQLVLNGGESHSYATGQTNEYVYINAEQGLEINSSPNNWQGNGWLDRNVAHINKADGTSTFPAQISVTSNGNSSQWNTAYGWGDHSTEGYLTSYNDEYTTGVTWTAATATLTFTRNDGDTYNVQMLETLTDVTVTGGTYASGTQILTLTKSDGSTVDVSGFAIDTDVNWYTTGATFNTGNGVITGTRSDGGTWTVDIDNRYLQLGGGTLTGNLTLNSTNPEILFNGTSDVGVDMAIKATPEGLDFYEPEDSNKIHFQILDDTGVNAAFGLQIGGTQVLSSGRVLSNVTGNISMFTNDSNYLTSFTETDPIFTASPSAGITDTNISNWNTAYGWGNHASAGYITGYSEVDTLDSVTTRGATTSNDITVGKLTTTWGEFTTTNNTNPGVDDLNVSGFGVLGNRNTNPIYLHNFGDGGVRIGVNTTLGNGVNGVFINDTTSTFYTDVTVTGTLSASGYNDSNWNTAYGWGDHSTEGYITGFTDTNEFVTGATFNSGNGVITFTRNNGGDTFTVDLDGRYLTSVTNISGYSGTLLAQDNRTISPSELSANLMKFGFTSWDNNNSGPYADFLHLRSYADTSGGADNLVMFKKSGIGMRIWQQTYGSATAYSSYEDVWTTGDFTSTNVSNWNTSYGWGDHASAGYITGYSETDPIYTSERDSLRLNKMVQSTLVFSVLEDYNKPSGYSTMIQPTSYQNPLTNTHGYYHILGRRDAGGGYGALLQSYNGNELFHGNTIQNTNNVTWYKIWTDSNFNQTEINNWGTAYSWGDHASAGYITGYSEVDTLATVTARGATTATSVRFSNDLNYFGKSTVNNEGEIVINTGVNGSPQIGFTEHGDASWALGIDDQDNSFKVHGTANSTIPTIDNLGTPLFEITTTAGLAYLNDNRIHHAGDFSTTDVANGVTSFGWGNHASVGYITGYSETDTLSTVTARGRRTHSNGSDVWNATTPGLGEGNIHLMSVNTDHAGGAITFNSSDANNAQAGIYVKSDGSYGTKMYIATTDSYATGSKTAISIDHNGLVNITRGDNRLQVNGNRVHHAGDFTTTDVANGVTAYGWGDHSLAGYTGDQDLSGYATETYVGTQIDNLIASAPGTLDTLNELAAALGDDPNFATTITTSIATKLPLAGGVMSGNIGRSAHNNGYLVGGYNNIGASATATNPIFTIGTSYLPAVTTLGNMYGIGYTRADASFMGVASGSGWGMYVAADGDARIWLDGSTGDIAASGTLSASGYNDSNWNTAYGWGNHASAGYLTSQDDDLPIGGGTLTGGLTIAGSVDSGATDMGYYQSAGTNIILKGDSIGRSGIFFESEKDGTNINDPSDYGFIQFHSYGYGNTSGEANNFVIGVSNDSTDKVILQAPYNGGVMIGYKDATSGTGLTLSEVIHSNSSSYNNGNWDTAYGWGDHAGAGYITSPNGGNADTLDLLDSTQFLRSDEADEATQLTVNTLIIGSSAKIQFQNNDFIRYDDANGAGRFHFDSDGGTNNASVQAATFVGALSGNATTATSSTNLYGLGYIQSNSSGTSYQNNYQIRENNGAGSNTAIDGAPTLAFHWSGVVASSIMMEASGRIAIRNNPGTGYEDFIANVITATGGNSGNWNTAYTYSQVGHLTSSSTLNASNMTTGTLPDVFSNSTRYNIGLIDGNGSQTRDKIRVWTDGAYTIGMKSGYQFGHLGNDYAMSFQMNASSDRGFWWGTSSDTDNQGAMALTTDGRANIKKSLSIGQGDTTSPSSTPLYVEGTTAGATVFEVHGTQGPLFSISDDMTGDIFEVSDISGVPILTVNASGTVTVDDTLHVKGDVIAYHSSDKRLKDNIKPILNPLDKIKLIGGYEFDWNEQSKNEGHDVGVIAQEIEEVLPELVSTRNDGYKGVRYEKLTALLIEANKELLNRVEELEKKLTKK